LYGEAINEYDREREFLSSSDHALRERAMIELDQKTGAAYLRKGDTENAEKYFKRALKKFEERIVKGADDPFTKYYIACLYALQGDADKAITALAETFTQLRALNTVRAKSDPDFDGIRDNPRFQELLNTTE
jgi:tetratricopeptide (TPR) repeat protein